MTTPRPPDSDEQLKELDVREMVAEIDELRQEKTSASRRRDLLRYTNTGAALALVPLIGVLMTSIERTSNQVEAHQDMYVEISQTLGRISGQVEEQGRLLRVQISDCDTRIKLLNRGADELRDKLEQQRQRIEDMAARARQSAVQAADSTVLAAVVQAISLLPPREQAPDAWLQDGRPHTEALARVVGRPIGAAERDRAWTLFTMAGGQ